MSIHSEPESIAARAGSLVQAMVAAEIVRQSRAAREARATADGKIMAAARRVALAVDALERVRGTDPRRERDIKRRLEGAERRLAAEMRRQGRLG